MRKSDRIERVCLVVKATPSAENFDPLPSILSHSIETPSYTTFSIQLRAFFRVAKRLQTLQISAYF